jgi:hypothetical protein
VDTGSEWGKGNECSASLDSDDTGLAVWRWSFTDYIDNVAAIIDDIGVCDATADFLLEDVKCGN